MKAKTIKKLLAVAMAAVGFAAFAAPAVTVNSVTENGTWSTIDVTYTLSGVNTSANYKMQFDVTVDGVTKTVTDDSFAKKSNTSYTKTIDTKTLFGSACRDAKAKVKVTLLDDQIDFAAGGQLWAGGPIFAGCNVGASKPEEYGYYFWWGDTVGYVRNATNDGWVSADGKGTTIEFKSKDATAKQTFRQTLTWLKNNGWIGEDGNLALAHDAARAHLKGDWRMPTYAEFKALKDNCDCKWATLNGVNGCIVTGKGDYASKGIFLPAAGRGENSSYGATPGKSGHYCSSTPYSNNSDVEWCISFSQSGGFDTTCSYALYRFLGYSIRPVR